LKPDAKISRDEFIKRMSEFKIGTSVHFIPLHSQPYWKNEYKLDNADFPNAMAYYENAVSLPIYTKMTDEDQTYVIQTIREILTHRE
jgi:dTDP-4-amino-4,6-dideoxygalactose transaminase